MLYQVKVPASSANLGPGFDALGLAVNLHLTCRFRAADRLEIHANGRDSELIAPGENNFIWQTALNVAAETGRRLPPLYLEIDNDIPIGKGLGSSAAALTAGVVIADRLLDLNWSPHRILHEAARIEGHPDNVAACVLGSIVASAIDSHGIARAVRLPLPEQFGVAIIVPDFVLLTHEARSVLPAQYSKADAIFNVQRAALLIAALATGTVTAFPAALEDRMHQPHRARLVPGLDEILKLRAPGLLGCALSGAGPSVLVFYERGSENVCDLVSQIFKLRGHNSQAILNGVATEGFSVTTLEV
ncbi:MAG: homoserine kinase [Acidobacteria bacterium]|nr:homoserine kinase [Acidobacteriota bacterium]